MKGIKTLTLLSIMMVNISLSDNIETNALILSSKRRNTSISKKANEIKKVNEVKEEDDFFNFSKAKKIELLLKVNSESTILSTRNMFLKNELYGSAKIYEFLKLSGGLDFRAKTFKPQNYYGALGLDFKEFGSIELKLHSSKKLDLKYEYEKKLKDLDINLNTSYSLFNAARKLAGTDNEIRVEHLYALNANLGYNLGNNFKLITDLNLSASTWKLLNNFFMYNLSIGAGLDYKNNVLAGIYIAHYNKREQRFIDDEHSTNHDLNSIYNKGFSFRGYVGYEWEKRLNESSKLGLVGKVGANLDKQIISDRSELNDDGEVEVIRDWGPITINNNSFATISPQLGLKYKVNDNLNIEVEYEASILFHKTGYIVMGNKIRTGLKYTGEKLSGKSIIDVLDLNSSSSNEIFKKNIYVRDNTELRLRHEKKENNKQLASNNPLIKYEVKKELNIGALIGKNKDLFVFLGGEVVGKDLKYKMDKKTNLKTIEGLDGIANIGLNFKRKLNKNIELTFNGGYQHKGGMEANVKEGLKLRGLWDKKYEEDEMARKEFYHSQGLRFKNDEVLISGVLDLDYETTKSKIGIIYSAEELVYEKSRFEGFLNLNQRLGNFNINGNFNYKLKDIHEVLDRMGRVKGDVSLSGKVGNLEIIGKTYVHIGSIIRSDKDRTFGGEGSLVYKNRNINLKTTLKHETMYDYSENESKEIYSKPRPKKDKTNSLVQKEEFLFNLGYINKNIELKSNIKVRSKILTDIKNGIKIDTNKYNKNDTNNKNKDFTVLLAYTDNELNTKLGDITLRLSSKYRYNMDMNDSKKLTHKHLGLVGVGITYDRKTNNLMLKNSIDARYLISYSDNEDYSIINAWMDNNVDYRVNNNLRLKGELNLTSSNKVKLLEKKGMEILALGDLKGIIEANLSDKVEFKNETGLNAIVLFDFKNGNNSISSSSKQQSPVLKELLLDPTHSYKVYNKNSLGYEIVDGIKLISNLEFSYLSGYKSDKLYSVLKDIKRKLMDENGIIGIGNNEKKKIEEEKSKYESKSGLSVIAIKPGIEGEFKILNDRLTVKPKVEVQVNFTNDSYPTYKYKSTNAKAILNIDYKW